MISSDNRHKPSRVILATILASLLLGLFVLSSCGGTRESQTASPVPLLASTVVTVQPTFTTEPMPGLIISGRVTDSSGAGVENAQIIRSYSAYPGEVVATTGADGYYASVFYPIPGDEMISVWAEKTGYVFAPEAFQWRHYYGFEQRVCDFQVKGP